MRRIVNQHASDKHKEPSERSELESAHGEDSFAIEERDLMREEAFVPALLQDC